MDSIFFVSPGFLPYLDLLLPSHDRECRRLRHTAKSRVASAIASEMSALIMPAVVALLTTNHVSRGLNLVHETFSHARYRQLEISSTSHTSSKPPISRSRNPFPNPFNTMPPSRWYEQSVPTHQPRLPPHLPTRISPHSLF